MKIKIEAVIYKLLYEKLHDKFFNDFVSDAEDKDSRNGWDSDYPGTKKKIANDLFQLKSPHYFLRKYEDHARQHIEVGYPLYPMTVDREQMVLALKYLLLGKDFELIGDFPELAIKDYQGWDWKKKYDKLLALFNEKYQPLKHLERDSSEVVLSDFDISQVFLSVVESDLDTFKSPIIENLIDHFFQALSSEKHHDAWGLLSRDFQKESIWDGDFKRFYSTFVGTRAFLPIGLGSYSYSYQRASCTVKYKEYGSLYNIGLIANEIKSLSGKNKEGRQNSQYWKAAVAFDKMVSAYKERLQELGQYHKPRLQWIKADQEKLIETTPEKLMDYNFQKAFLTNTSQLLILSGLYNMGCLYEEEFIADFICIYSNGKWQIDNWLIKKAVDSGIRYLPID